ncbi:AAA family ATPase [Flavihumibacter fluvii]|uniref:AAA family ATPase n=1 Tax=Flavihumibacter fluvii TaxID=2838157 RepID=UPI001BDE8CF3|nr:AAA family ATPase [Flavihumibacter fluvii]ULQ51658.1 AAA family ATPase [Flavihumibacter fluvii]
MVKKIVAIGPESTGKSTICEQLAIHYQTSWCPEYAREYLLKNGPGYTYEDLLTIAMGQVTMEDELTQHIAAKYPDGSGILFVDTDMYVMKVWCEYVFGKCHSFILDQIASRKYDHYLLCSIDIPWKADHLREYPNLAPRQELFNMYKDILVNQSTPWILLEGTADQRIQKAGSAIKRFLK